MRNLVLIALLGLIGVVALAIIGMVVIAAVIDGSTAQAVIGYLHDIAILGAPIVFGVVQYYIHGAPADPTTPATPAGGGPAAASTDPLSGAA